MSESMREPKRDWQDGLRTLVCASDGFHVPGKNGVVQVLASGDGAVEYIVMEDRILGYVPSAMGYPAYYPVWEAASEKPVRAVLMDLDGTTVHSEPFWIYIIEETVHSLTGRQHFSFGEEDIPFVSGRSVTEHLSYCIDKYCPGASLEKAREAYFRHTHREMKAILEGTGRMDAFVPAPGVGEFLRTLKGRGILIGLVTSGLYEKAYPEIYSAFQTLGMGRPEDFYDCIITAGYPLVRGGCGTLGELAPKPHPWLYAEAGAVGLGIPFSARSRVLGIEDSAAGIHAIRLAGYSSCGIAGGNIRQSGAISLCDDYCESFEEILRRCIL